MLKNRFSQEDAERISRLIARNLQLVNILDYSSQTIEALIPSYTPEWIQDLAQYVYMIDCLELDRMVCPCC